MAVCCLCSAPAIHAFDYNGVMYCETCVQGAFRDPSEVYVSAMDEARAAYDEFVAACLVLVEHKVGEGVLKPLRAQARAMRKTIAVRERALEAEAARQGCDVAELRLLVAYERQQAEMTGQI